MKGLGKYRSGMSRMVIQENVEHRNFESLLFWGRYDSKYVKIDKTLKTRYLFIIKMLQVAQFSIIGPQGSYICNQNGKTLKIV